MTARPYLKSVPLAGQDAGVWLREAANGLDGLIKRANAVAEITLTANAGSTTIYHPMLGYYSHVSFMPQTANAAAEIGAGTLYVAQATMVEGSCVVTHANNAQTDRTFRIKIDG